MKKILLLAAVLMSVSVASAQFTKGDVFLAGSATGLDLSTTSTDGTSSTNLGLMALGGYFLNNFIAVELGLGANYAKVEGMDATKSLAYQVGLRAYLVEDLFAGLAYTGQKMTNVNALSFVGVQVGYDLFLSEKVFFEPALYYQKGLSELVKKQNTFGLSLGVGVKF